MIKVTSPTGSTIKNRLKDDGSEIGSERRDGIYGISYVFEKEGPYKVEIIAQGETFDRKKSLFINVKSTTFKTPFIIKQDIIKEVDILNSISESNIKDQENAQENKIEKTDKQNDTGTTHESTHENSESHNTKTHTASINNKNNHDNAHNDHENDENLTEDLKAQDINNEEDSAHKKLDTNGSFGVKDAVIAFTLFNIFLLSLGGGYYAWYRKKQKQKEKDLNDNAAENKTVDDKNPTEIASSIDENESGLDLEVEDSLSTSISDIDLEEELSSILESDEK